MRHIEFIGVPGSGKSTIYECLSRRLSEEGYRVYRSDDMKHLALSHKLGIPYFNQSDSGLLAKIAREGLRLGNSCLNVEAAHLQPFVAEHPDLMSLVFHYIAQNSNSQSQEELCVQWFCQTSSRYEISKKILDEDEIILFDEGFAHRSNIIFEFDRELPEQSVRDYTTNIPLPDDLIILEVPIKTAYNRMKKRASKFPKFYSDLNHSSRIKLLERNKKIITLVSDVLETRGCQIHRVNNTERIATICDRVYNKLAI